MIYKKLSDNRKITINYKYFCALLRKYGLIKKPEQYFSTMIDREKSDIYTKIKYYKEFGIDFNDETDFSEIKRKFEYKNDPNKHKRHI